jgi:predicted RNA-binding protein with PIN domain
MGRDILVDGYNIIKRGASFQAIAARNLAAARNQLVTQLVNRYRHTPHQVIVVFDGDGASEQTSYDRRIRIIYSRHDETADSVIARLASEARAARREVEMYSDDTEVRQIVAQQGGDVYTTGQLTNSLNAAPRDVARRHRYRQAMRRKYGLDAANDPDDELDRTPSPRGKKKTPRRRE